MIYRSLALAVSLAALMAAPKAFAQGRADGPGPSG